MNVIERKMEEHSQTGTSYIIAFGIIVVCGLLITSYIIGTYNLIRRYYRQWHYFYTGSALNREIIIMYYLLQPSTSSSTWINRDRDNTTNITYFHRNITQIPSPSEQNQIDSRNMNEMSGQDTAESIDQMFVNINQQMQMCLQMDYIIPRLKYAIHDTIVAYPTSHRDDENIALNPLPLFKTTEKSHLQLIKVKFKKQLRK